MAQYQPIKRALQSSASELRRATCWHSHPTELSSKNKNDEITSMSLRYEENVDISTEKKKAQDMCHDSELSQRRMTKQEDEQQYSMNDNRE